MDQQCAYCGDPAEGLDEDMEPTCGRECCRPVNEVLPEDDEIDLAN